MSERARDGADADVVVVGGGPAGSAAALLIARAGLAVTLVERSAFPRPLPGETLHPGAESVLRHLGVWEQVEALAPLRHQGIRVSWGAPARFDAFGRDANGPWRGLQLWRADLDALLLDAARSAGARVRQPCDALRVIEEAGRVAGVHTSLGAVRARFVIDASGGRHWLARRLGLPVQRVSGRLIARYGYAPRDQVDDTPSLTTSASGWTWVAPIDAHQQAWTALDVRGQRPPRPSGGELGPSSSRDVSWRSVAAMAGRGWCIAGDAAFVVDPASSHGVLRALISGVHAAQHVTRALRVPGDEPTLELGYSRWSRAWFERDVRRLSEMYRAAFPAWPAVDSRFALTAHR